MGAADAVVGPLLRDRRQERRDLDGRHDDRVSRLNPKTGAIVEYLLPQDTNIRRVFVDNTTTPVTFWIGNNHGASIVKVEPLE